MAAHASLKKNVVKKVNPWTWKEKKRMEKIFLIKTEEKKEEEEMRRAWILEDSSGCKTLRNL
jgi:hypothetical protein